VPAWLEGVRAGAAGHDHSLALYNVDLDGDGLPDTWEMQHFGDLSGTADGNDDSDALTNIQEYLHGTDPQHHDTAPDANTAINLQVYTPLQ
jgi:hypothetical protein